MAKQYPSDFARGYDYGRRRYADLVAVVSLDALLALASALHAVTGSDAELAQGIAAGLGDMANTASPPSVDKCRPTM